MASTWWPDTAVSGEFLSPSVIVSGDGSITQAPAVLANHLGISTGCILIAADDIVVANGMVIPLISSLENAGLSVVLTSGFGSEPSSEAIDSHIAQAREAQAVAVIGVGGGSVLDSAKLIALLLNNEGGSADWLGPVNPPRGVAPLLLVPTTCGTGSEATRIAMLTVDGIKRASSCAKYIPDAVIIDPELVATLPPLVIASTGMDALAHAVESLMSTAHSPMTAHHAFRAIELLMGNIEAACAGNKNALAQCLWASHLAGQSLNAGVALGHSLAYCLAFEHPMAHGTSCALALSYCLAYNQHLPTGLGEALSQALTDGKSSSLRAAAQTIMDLCALLGLPTTLKDVSIPIEAEKRMAARCVVEYPRPSNPVPLVEAQLETLLGAMREGDLDAAFAVTARGAKQ
jgi:alcohol dehydrogenase class IV